MKKLMVIFAAIFGIFCMVQEVAAGENIKIKVINPLNESRSCETISIDLSKLADSTSSPQAGFEKIKPAVYSDNLKKFIPCQLMDENGDGTNDELIFQSDFKAKQVQLFEITEANATNQVQLEYGAVANYIPQRKDDFAWENDKLGFRMYGQELQRTELTSSGIDVWMKKAKRPVMLDLYAKGHDYYHHDNPMAIDFYNIGSTLGCGGLGVWFDGKLLMSENYYQWKIIANGPIRTIFELSYKPWDMGGKKIGEVKRISLDISSNFNRIESRFGADVKDITFAVGVTKKERNRKAAYSKNKRVLSTWEDAEPRFGIIGCGVILPKEAAMGKTADDGENYLLLAKAKNNSIVYYAGAGWNRTAGFETKEKWNAFAENTAKLIANPLVIKIK
ncbi:MAG: DUF4861 domain-containing protein [Phycisphaerae bacterium]|jgi:hypothetical protein